MYVNTRTVPCYQDTVQGMLELNSETDGTSDNEHYFQNMGNSLTINMVDRNYSTIGLSPQIRTPCMFSPLHTSCFNMHQDNRAMNPLKQVILGFLW